MSVTFGSSLVIVDSKWDAFKTKVIAKQLAGRIQFDESDDAYVIFAFDTSVVYRCTILKGTVPSSPGWDQTENDNFKADFEANYKPYGNKPLTVGGFNDPRVVHRFGNLNAASASEVLISAAAYNEPASQGQRSIKSSSANDSNPSGSGAKEVRIEYLDSNYVLKTEDVLLNGTSSVTTVATDIRFIESFKVIKGAAAAGTISLFPTTNGTGTAICAIGSSTEDAFLCHHYVPAGMQAYVLGWGVTTSDDVNVKLKGQVRYGSNLVDVNMDLDNISGSSGALAAGSRVSFYREFKGGMTLGEKTYVRVTAVPGQATSTIIRGILDLWEDKA